MLNGVLSVLEPYEVKVSSTVLRGERTEMSRPTRHAKNSGGAGTNKSLGAPLSLTLI